MPDTGRAGDTPADRLHALVLEQLDEDQAQELVSIPLAGKSSIADHMIIASGRSTRQVAAMAQKLAEKIKQGGFGNARIEGLPAAHLRQTRWAKGSYFSYGALPFCHLVYPVPEPGGLGVHLTLDLGGAAKFGPDVLWIDKIDYRLDDARREAFAEAISRYWPGVIKERLQPGYCGIRPKLSGPGEPAADFAIDGPETHGVEGLVNLFGIESPGLTASLAMAERVITQLKSI